MDSIAGMDHSTITELFQEKKYPLVFCDIAAFDHNLALLRDHFAKIGKKMRLCSKSLRVPYLIQRAAQEDFINGVLFFNAVEAPYLATELGISDLMAGYPTSSPFEVEKLCEAAKVPETRVTAMVDSREHLDLLDRGAKKAGVTLDICVDLDVAFYLFGMKLGVDRSPLRTPAQVLDLVRLIDMYPHLSFRGLMGYEAQNAGVSDANPLIRFIKHLSMRQVIKVRGQIVSHLVKNGYPPELVNGGGSGCHIQTAADPVVTEVGIGSALYKSHIFDPLGPLANFQPSMFMALQVVRFPKPGMVTCFSGGYASSGSYIPPITVLPKGISVTKREGFGEVQTPVTYDPTEVNLKLGDSIICRLAKAGEPMEEFDKVYLVRDGKIEVEVPTYRGVGICGG